MSHTADRIVFRGAVYRKVAKTVFQSIIDYVIDAIIDDFLQHRDYPDSPRDEGGAADEAGLHKYIRWWIADNAESLYGSVYDHYDAQQFFSEVLRDADKMRDVEFTFPTGGGDLGELLLLTMPKWISAYLWQEDVFNQLVLPKYRARAGR